MSKVTGKLQITIPKALAERHHISPGCSVHFDSMGRDLLLRLEDSQHKTMDRHARLASFDESTRRLRNLARPSSGKHPDRGWTRDDLYERGLPR